MNVNGRQRWRFFPVFCVLTFLAACSSPPDGGEEHAAAPAPSTPPNVVVILADDLGIGDLGCYQPGSRIPTPHYDRLAREGMRFDDAHSPSAVCTPTRYGLLTGRYCWRTRLKSGVLWGRSKFLFEPGRQTVASLLRQKGYRTGVVGKWHLGLGNDEKTDYSRTLKPGPAEAGFDYSCIIPASLDIPPYLWIENGEPDGALSVQDPGSKRVWSGGGGFWRKGLRTPTFDFHRVLPKTAEKSVAFLEERGKDGKPFFLYVPFASPHTPWIPNAEYQGRSEAGTYGDFVHETDAAVGRILDTLDRLELAENTIVLVTSDNGSHWPRKQIEKFQHDANMSYRGMKADIWEGGHRVPFIVRWPARVPAGTTSSQLVSLTDVMATVASVVGHSLSEDEGEDSISFLPVLTSAGVAGQLRQDAIHHSVNGTFAIRSGTWKLIEGNLGSGGFTAPRVVKPEPEGPAGQLYDLAQDPKESTNLYTEQPEVVTRLTALLEEQRRSGRSR